MAYNVIQLAAGWAFGAGYACVLFTIIKITDFTKRINYRLKIEAGEQGVVTGALGRQPHPKHVLHSSEVNIAG